MKYLVLTLVLVGCTEAVNYSEQNEMLVQPEKRIKSAASFWQSCSKDLPDAAYSNFIVKKSQELLNMLDKLKNSNSAPDWKSVKSGLDALAVSDFKGNSVFYEVQWPRIQKTIKEEIAGLEGKLESENLRFFIAASFANIMDKLCEPPTLAESARLTSFKPIHENKSGDSMLWGLFSHYTPPTVPYLFSVESGEMVYYPSTRISRIETIWLPKAIKPIKYFVASGLGEKFKVDTLEVR